MKNKIIKNLTIIFFLMHFTSIYTSSYVDEALWEASKLIAKTAIVTVTAVTVGGIILVKIVNIVNANTSKVNKDAVKDALLEQSTLSIKPQLLTSQDNFNNIVGKIPDDLKNIRSMLKNKEYFTGVGAQMPRGFLLVGVPGTGKTSMVRALAQESGMLFYSFSGGELGGKLVGLGVEQLKEIVKTARDAAKQNKTRVIIFFDEFDAIGGRGNATSFDSGDQRRTISAFLEQMTLPENKDIFWIGATNDPANIDEGIKRPGRLDFCIKIPTPDSDDRKAIFELYMTKKGYKFDPSLLRSDALNKFLVAWSNKTNNYTGADIKGLVNRAAIYAGVQKDTFINETHLNKAWESMQRESDAKEKSFLRQRR